MNPKFATFPTRYKYVYNKINYKIAKNNKLKITKIIQPLYYGHVFGLLGFCMINHLRTKKMYLSV